MKGKNKNKNKAKGAKGNKEKRQKVKAAKVEEPDSEEMPSMGEEEEELSLKSEEETSEDEEAVMEDDSEGDDEELEEKSSEEEEEEQKVSKKVSGKRKGKAGAKFNGTAKVEVEKSSEEEEDDDDDDDDDDEDDEEDDEDEDEKIKLKTSVAKKQKIEENTTSHEDYNICIKNLPFSATENDIAEFFDEVKEDINKINLLTLPDGKSKGIAFVYFETEGSYNKALRYNSHDFNGRRVIVNSGMRSQNAGYNQGSQIEEPTVFVRGFDVDNEEDEVARMLRETFGKCGDIVDVRIGKHQDTGALKGFAHVQFATSEAKDEALLLSGTEMGGYDLFVDNVINKRENNNSYCEHCGRGCDEDNRYSQRNDYGGGGGGGGWRGGRNSRGGGVRGGRRGGRIGRGGRGGQFGGRGGGRHPKRKIDFYN